MSNASQKQTRGTCSRKLSHTIVCHKGITERAYQYLKQENHEKLVVTPSAISFWSSDTSLNLRILCRLAMGLTCFDGACFESRNCLSLKTFVSEGFVSEHVTVGEPSTKPWDVKLPKLYFWNLTGIKDTWICSNDYCSTFEI